MVHSIWISVPMIAIQDDNSEWWYQKMIWFVNIRKELVQRKPYLLCCLATSIGRYYFANVETMFDFVEQTSQGDKDLLSIRMHWFTGSCEDHNHSVDWLGGYVRSLYDSKIREILKYFVHWLQLGQMLARACNHRKTNLQKKNVARCLNSLMKYQTDAKTRTLLHYYIAASQYEPDLDCPGHERYASVGITTLESPIC
jgi:hypothetical protein